MKILRIKLVVWILLSIVLIGCGLHNNLKSYLNPESGYSFNYPKNWDVTFTQNDEKMQTIEFEEDNVWRLTMGIIKGQVKNSNSTSSVEILEDELKRRFPIGLENQQIVILEEAQTVPSNKYDIASAQVSSREYLSDITLPIDFVVSYKVIKHKEEYFLLGITGPGNSEHLDTHNQNVDIIFDSFSLLKGE